MRTVPTLVIDCNKLFREGLKKLFDASSFEVCAEASDLPEAVAKLNEGLDVALIILDFRTGEKEEIAHIRTIRENHPEVRVVVLTNEICTRRLAQSLEAGADGYLLKDMSSAALKQSLNLVMLGEKVFPTDLATYLIGGKISGPQSRAEEETYRNGLSEREVQILKCLLNGYSNKVIANRLNITEATVKVHLKGVLRKINAANRTQAAIWALNHGLGNASTATPTPAQERVAP